MTGDSPGPAPARDPAPVARLRGLVGRRVVVRFRPDPAARPMTDVLGVLQAIGHGPAGRAIVLADRDGRVVEIPLTHVVAAKDVPPRPPRRPPRE